MTALSELIQESKELDAEIKRIHTRMYKRGSSNIPVANLCYLWRLRKNKINAQKTTRTRGLPIKQIMEVLKCSKTSAQKYQRALVCLQLIEEERELDFKILQQMMNIPKRNT